MCGAQQNAIRDRVQRSDRGSGAAGGDAVKARGEAQNTALAEDEVQRGDHSGTTRPLPKKLEMQKARSDALLACNLMVGMTGFEPATSASRTRILKS